MPKVPTRHNEAYVKLFEEHSAANTGSEQGTQLARIDTGVLAVSHGRFNAKAERVTKHNKEAVKKGWHIIVPFEIGEVPIRCANCGVVNKRGAYTMVLKDNESKRCRKAPSDPSTAERKVSEANAAWTKLNEDSFRRLKEVIWQVAMGQVGSPIPLKDPVMAIAHSYPEDKAVRAMTVVRPKKVVSPDLWNLFHRFYACKIRLIDRAEGNALSDQNLRQQAATPMMMLVFDFAAEIGHARMAHNAWQNQTCGNLVLRMRLLIKA